MASMRSDKPFKAWLVGRNRKRRMEADPQPPEVATIEWVSAPPTTGTTNTDYTATWKGGLPPYRAVIEGATVLLNDQVSYDGTMTLNVNGTNQPAGDYTWTITDAHGNELTEVTTIS